MNKRYTESLVTPTHSDNVVNNDDVAPLVNDDLVIEYLKGIFDDPQVHPLNKLKAFYQIDEIRQPIAVGLAGAVRGSMFENIWMVQGQPANAESVVLWAETPLPQWYVRFETGDKLVRVISANLRSDYYTFLVGTINDMYRERAGTLEINSLTVDQHNYFVAAVNRTLRAL